MEFTYRIETKDDTMDVYLKGFLDTQHASGLMDDMKIHVAEKYKTVIFHMDELEYMASLGVRIIIFTKQKMGRDTEVILENPQENVASTIELSGLQDMLSQL